MNLRLSVTIKEITLLIKEKRVSIIVPLSKNPEENMIVFIIAIMENGQKIVKEAKIVEISSSNASTKDGKMCNVHLEKGY